MQTDALKVVWGYNPSQNSETALFFPSLLPTKQSCWCVRGMFGGKVIIWTQHYFVGERSIEKQHSIRSLSIGLNIFCEGLSLENVRLRYFCFIIVFISVQLVTFIA